MPKQLRLKCRERLVCAFVIETLTTVNIDYRLPLIELTRQPGLEGRTPYEKVTGSTPNITPYALFDWYDPIYFHQPVAGYPHQKRELGRVIGVADNCTDELAYVVLTKTGRVQVRKSIWAIEPHKFNDFSV